MRGVGTRTGSRIAQYALSNLLFGRDVVAIVAIPIHSRGASLSIVRGVWGGIGRLVRLGWADSISTTSSTYALNLAVDLLLSLRGNWVGDLRLGLEDMARSLVGLSLREGGSRVILRGQRHGLDFVVKVVKW